MALLVEESACNSPLWTRAGERYIAGATGGAKSIEVIENGVFDGAGASFCFSRHWHECSAQAQFPQQHVLAS